MDIQIENTGSIVLIRPLTGTAMDWLQEKTDGQWFGNALACEPRYIDDIIEGLIDDGFEVG